MKINILPLLLLGLIPGMATGQKHTTHQPQYWLRYSAAVNFPAKTQLLFDAESRRFFEEKGYAAAFLRGQLQVQLKGNFAVDAAAAHFHFYGQNYSEAELQTHPHYADIRLHQSILQKHVSGKFSITNRLRLEERFVQQNKAKGSDKFDLLPRLRLALLVNYLMGEKWELRASNDVVFNVFQKDALSLFERNLFGFGVYRKLSKNTGIELGYLSQLISRQPLGEYLQRNVLKLYFTQNFNVKKLG
ncbi:MAG: DUF2490 domain-containing protein [Bacteroidetes bacterium]|nr:DUF2490 domain-containing protein [Bacteroidota bacterium]